MEKSPGMDLVSYSIIIPIFNEKDNICPLYHNLKEQMLTIGKSFEIIFVDDCSEDGSVAAIQKESGPDPCVKVIRLKQHSGQSFALQTGFRAAQGRQIITIDGDCQYDPKDIKALLIKAKEEDLDVVCGWRKDRKDPLHKVIFSRSANYIRRAMLRESVHDVGCSLRVYSRKALEGIALSKEGHRFLTAILKRKGCSLGEVVVRHYPRSKGTSKYGILDRMIISLFSYFTSIFPGVNLLQRSAPVC